MAAEIKESVQTSFTDLPVEILQEIAEYLDDHSLLQLGSTCKYTNVIGLSAFFSRHDIWDARLGYLNLYRKPAETLPALRAALFVQEVKQINYAFDQAPDKLFDEVADLRAFVGRLTTVDEVMIQVCLWMTAPLPSYRVDMRVWEELYTSLLDMILDRSCTYLSVWGGGGDEIHILYPPTATPAPHHDIISPNPSPVSVLHTAFGPRSLKAAFRRIFRLKARKRPPQRTNPQELPPTLPVEPATHESFQPLPQLPPRERKLRALAIHSDMLSRGSFLTWTLSTISGASATLTKLHFTYITIPPGTWRTLLAGISLPRLLDFRLSTSTGTPLLETGTWFTDVRCFLVRHPSLSILDLYGVELSPEGREWPVLPKLGNLTAHLAYIPGIISSDNTPSLNAITVSVEEPPFDYDLVDAALHAVALFPRSISLTLRFTTKHGVSKWFATHRQLGRQGSVLASLHLITSLTIDCAWAALPADVVVGFPEWLAIFPSVQQVAFINQIRAERHFLTPDFIKRLATVCPKLKEVRTEEDRVWMNVGDANLVGCALQLPGSCHITLSSHGA